jgi:hypothetical protein
LRDFLKKYVAIFSLLKRRRVGKSIFIFVPEVSNLKVADFTFSTNKRAKIYNP